MNKIYLFVMLLFTTKPIHCQMNACTIDTNQCFIQKQYMGGKLVLEKKWESIDTIGSTKTPLLVDINGDCIPEIITFNDGYSDETAEILIINSKTGKTISTIKTPYFFSDPTNFTLADIDSDNIPEIFILVSSSTKPNSLRDKIICFNIDGTIRWISDQPFYKPLNRGYTGNLGIADFNQDGIQEIYVFNSIFNAKTGKLLVHGGNNGVGHYLGSSTIAANLDKNNSDLELAAGYSVYKVVINNSNGTLGNTMTTRNINIDGALMDGFTAVSDINKDGQLDIIVSGYVNNTLSTILYVYTMRKGIPRLLAKSEPANFNSFGSPTIGIIDGTNNPSIIVGGKNVLETYFYDGTTNLKKRWVMNISDASTQTGVVLFDLNNDGIQEIVYRDEKFLYIINEKVQLPIIQSKYQCQSGTIRESPIIGDILGDGQSYICVACSDVPLSSVGKLLVFGSPDSLPPWAPARRVWNQSAYNVLNINDDLTVPQYQKNNATYENGRYNNFMQQQSLLDSNGNYKVRAGSLDGIIHCINYDPKADEYTATFDIYNRSSASLTIPSGLPVSFFNGDPQGSGTLIGIYHTTSDIPPGGSLTNLIYTFSAANLTALFMVVNSDKTGFNPIDDKDFLNPECDYLDNFSQNTSIPRVELRVDSICNGDSYIFGDTTLTTAGNYYRRFQNESGCDSLYVSLDLDVIDTLLMVSDFTACDSFEWRGTVYYQSGFYTRDFISINGCDSTIAINLTITSSTSSTIEQAACDRFMWKGQTFTQSGMYAFDTLNALNCDSSIMLDLTIHPSRESSVTKTVCEAYTWHGNTYDQTGQYRFDTMTIFGCDSIITLNLFIRDTIKTSDMVHICQGDSVFIFGEYISEDKRVSQLFVTPDGCDSIQTFEVIIDPLLQGQINKNICEGDSVFVIDRWLKNEGNYSLSKSNIDGCDSVFMVRVSVLQTYRSNDTIQLCFGDTLMIFGTEVTREMDLMHSFMANNGCDSLVNVHIEMIPPSNSQIEYTLCPGDSIFINGQWIKEEGIYTETWTALNGCDSMVLTDVKVLESPRGPTAELDCETLEITASIEIQNPWSVRWDNGDTTAQTTYKNQSTATLTLFTQPNCVEQFTIRLPPIPRLGGADLQKDTILTPGGSLNIDLGLDPNEWSVRWSPSDIVSCDTCMQVVITPKEDVQINLFFTHKSGCTFESSFRIKLVNEGIYIPNAFTPNGDGINDSWSPLHTPNITLLHIQIYDRWGELVYDSDHQHLLRWNGIFNGRNALPGVYTYVVEYLNAKGETLLKAGDLTLVR